jgi:hypothetical protein
MRFEPISTVGYNGIQKWRQMERARGKDASKASSDTNLLRLGLPQGCIKDITEDMGIVLIDTRDDSAGASRSPRYFDPAGIALVRLLLFGGGAIRFNSKNVGMEEQMDYLVLSGHKDGEDSTVRYLNEEKESRIGYKDVDLGKIPLRRLIANTAPGLETFSYDHSSYRRCDLYITSSERNYLQDKPLLGKSPRTSRIDSIEIAIRQLLNNPLKHEVPMGPQGLGTLIQGTFDLLDKIPLGQAPNFQTQLSHQ